MTTTYPSVFRTLWLYLGLLTLVICFALPAHGQRRGRNRANDGPREYIEVAANRLSNESLNRDYLDTFIEAEIYFGSVESSAGAFAPRRYTSDDWLSANSYTNASDGTGQLGLVIPASSDCVNVVLSLPRGTPLVVRGKFIRSAYFFYPGVIVVDECSQAGEAAPVELPAEFQVAPE